MGKRIIMITHAELLRRFMYDPATGDFISLLAWRRWKAGRKVGWVHTTGCIIITIDGVDYRAHRLAFFYMTGRWPDPEVDHRNGHRRDNRWENLREATRGQNACNLPIPSHNTSGIKGVSWSNERQKWFVCIQKDGRTIPLGRYHSIDDAAAAYKAAETKYFGEFVRAA